jgi:hypothetical protein
MMKRMKRKVSGQGGTSREDLHLLVGKYFFAKNADDGTYRESRRRQRLTGMR